MFGFPKKILPLHPIKKGLLLNDLKIYNIAFSGLKIGTHQFDYQVDGSFFNFFEGAEIHDAKLHVRVDLEKQETMLIFHFHIEGTIQTLCDRCLELCELDIEKEANLIVKYGDRCEEISDEIITVSRSTSSLDISQYIYEFTILALPIQRMHPNIGGVNGCNEKTVSYLNKETKYQDTNIDPRWEVLNKLNN